MKVFNPNQYQAKKRFGQNFLQDPGIIERIVKSIRPQPGDNLLEIGPGLGAITRQILPLAQKISVIELDRDVIPKLKFNCDGLGELNVYQQDVLKTDLAAFYNQQPIRVIGNLPYNISTPILFHLFEYLPLIKDMHFMLQKEVVERMTAEPGSKVYGRLSVMTQYFCSPQLLFLVPPEAFEPAPKVESAIVRMTPNQNLLPLVSFDLFASLVADAFNMRRKTLRNVWRHRICEQDLIELGIEPSLRPEMLSLGSFVAVANWVAKNSLSAKT